MNKGILTVFLLVSMVLLAGRATAALADSYWTANHNIDLTIDNGQSAQFEYTVQAVTSQAGIYSVSLYKEGVSTPIKTYVYNKATVNNGAGDYINVQPSDYQNTAGDYYVLLSASDNFGTDTNIISLHVNPVAQPLSISCNAVPTFGVVPLNAQFSATATGGSGIYSTYTWNFADTTYQNTVLPNAVHTYTIPGTYNPTVQITDSNGKTALAACTLSGIKVSAKPLVATCSLNPSTGTEPLFVSFVGNADGGNGAYVYQWIFDDGNTLNTPT